MAVPAKLHRAERSFGRAVGGVLLALGAWWTYRGKFSHLAPIFLVLGGVLVLLASVAPAWLRAPNRAWMRLGEGLSWGTTRITLAIVFYLVVTPIGILRRAFGGDPLRRRGAAKESYWTDYPERHLDPKHYEKMY